MQVFLERSCLASAKPQAPFFTQGAFTEEENLQRLHRPSMKNMENCQETFGGEVYPICSMGRTEYLPTFGINFMVN